MQIVPGRCEGYPHTGRALDGVSAAGTSDGTIAAMIASQPLYLLAIFTVTM